MTTRKGLKRLLTLLMIVGLFMGLGVDGDQAINATATVKTTQRQVKTATGKRAAHQTTQKAHHKVTPAKSAGKKQATRHHKIKKTQKHRQGTKKKSSKKRAKKRTKKSAKKSAKKKTKQAKKSQKSQAAKKGATTPAPTVPESMAPSSSSSQPTSSSAAVSSSSSAIASSSLPTTTTPVPTERVSISINGPISKGNPVLLSAQVPITTGETVLDVLEQAAATKNMQVSVSGSSKSAYVRGIDGLFEKDFGQNSGWLYQVNGTFPNISCGSYPVKNGDEIAWLYTENLGTDRGAPMS